MRRRAPAISSALAAFALMLWSALALASSGPSEPRLILPGDRAVRSGEVIDLRWTAADSVSELEILVSDDGGRHYSHSISPRLDPNRCDFVWRVPDWNCATLRLRIRFNRGGREIEGAPTGPLQLAADSRECSEPLGLPSGDFGAEGPARTGTRDPAPESSVPVGPFEAVGHATSFRRRPATESLWRVFPKLVRDPRAATFLPALADRGPRFVPLRT